MPCRRAAEGYAALAPAHGQEAGELRGDARRIRQLLAILDRLHGGRRLGLDPHRRLPRRTEAALGHGHHRTVLHGATDHLADRLALTQHFYLESRWLAHQQRPDERHRQRAHRPPGRHLEAHGLVKHGGHQATEGGTPLPPQPGYNDMLGVGMHRVDQFSEGHAQSPVMLTEA